MQLILTGSISELLVRLAAPNILATGAMTAVIFADVYYVGQLGTKALASLAIVFPFQTLMGMMSNGAIGGGVASSIVRSLGSNDAGDAESAAWHALGIGAVGAVIYTVVLGVFARPMLGLLIDSGDVLDGAVSYAYIVFGGAAVMWTTYMLSAILRGIGAMGITANAVIGASIIHVFLAGALTLGWGPFPEVGLNGPAIAMVVSHALALAYLSTQVFRGTERLNLKRYPISIERLKDIMQVGGLGLINSSGLVLTVIVVTAFVGRFGEEALAGYGLGSRLELTLVPLAFGVGGALVTTVGGNFGAGQFGRARKIAWTGAGVTFGVTMTLGVLISVVPEIWLDLFTTEPEVFNVGALYLGIAALTYGVFAGGQTLYFASQGTGNMVIPVVITYTRFAVVAGFGMGALWFDWSLETVFTGVAIGLAVVGLGQILNVALSRSWNPE